MTESGPVSLDDVRRDELEAIAKRRELNHLPKPAIPDTAHRSSDLVGVALSGGGLRSACFNLGVVQVLLRTGLWRFVDYLSTVSGGGYIGAFLASYIIRKEAPLTRENCPLLPAPAETKATRATSRHSGAKPNASAGEASQLTGPQPPDVRRFIYGGRFLLKPWEMLNKYLIGLLFMNAAIFSIIALAAAAVAYLWRSLDFDYFRDRALLLGLRGDLIFALIPFLLFSTFWLIAWIVSYVRRGAEAPGAYARVWLVLTGASLAIGGALLMGNGDIDLSMFSTSNQPFKFDQNKGLVTTVVAVILGSLLPFLSPSRLIQSGLQPKKQWEQWLFGLTSTAALVGVPLLMVGAFARENISGFNTDPYRPVVRGDFEEIDAIVDLLWPGDAKLDALRGPQVPNEASPAGKGQSTSLKIEVSDPIKALYLDPSKKIEGGSLNKKYEFPVQIGTLIDFRQRTREALLGPEEKRTERFQQLCNEVELVDKSKNPTFAFPLDSLSSQTSQDPQRRVERRLKLLLLLQDVSHQYQRCLEEYHGIDQHYTSWQRTRHWAQQMCAGLIYLTSFNDAESDAADVDNLRFRERRLADSVAAIVNNDILTYPLMSTSEEGEDSVTARLQLARVIELAKWQVAKRQVAKQQASAPFTAGDKSKSDSQAGDVASAEKSKSDSQVDDAESLKPATSQLSPEESKRLTSLISASKSQNLAQWSPQQLFEFNRLLLEEKNPDALRPRSAVRRAVTLAEDQVTRAWIVLIALGVVVVIGWQVDANATSMHRFYRMRLAKAFIVPQKNKADSPALTDLCCTTEQGSPYFLINSSSGLVFDRTGHEDIPAGLASHAGSTPYFRSTDTFLMSAQYCGSDTLGYVSTEQYEAWIKGEENHLCLAEATAVSGAAVSPGQVTNKFLAFLMFTLNLRLGQWLPNPAYGPPRRRPRVLALLLSQFKPQNLREYCFVSDGGNCENLGIIQLLRRRCRLVVQVDVSHDPRHSFGDLAKAIRIARIHDGIRLVSLNNEAHECETEYLRLFEPPYGPKNEDGAGRWCRQHFFVARILYPDGAIGTLAYLKPSFTGDESIDVQQFRSKNEDFPHDSTSDQEYEPEQVEAYRHLGCHIGEDLCAAMGISPEESIWNRRDLTVEQICKRLEDDWLAKTKDKGESAGKARPTTGADELQKVGPVLDLASSNSAALPPDTNDAKPHAVDPLAIHGSTSPEEIDDNIAATLSDIKSQSDSAVATASPVVQTLLAGTETLNDLPTDSAAAKCLQQIESAQGDARQIRAALNRFEIAIEETRLPETQSIVPELARLLTSCSDRRVGARVIRILTTYATECDIAREALRAATTAGYRAEVRKAADVALHHVAVLRRTPK